MKVKVINKDNCCQFCSYRKELYKDQIPKECKECGFINHRDKPYTVDIPIEEDK